MLDSTFQNSTLTINDVACFGSEPARLELAKTNFIYGPNGTGKSSIARKIKEIDFVPRPDELDVELFNQDYISRFIDPSASIDGVFRIRAGSQEVQQRLLELQGDEKNTGEIALAEKHLVGLNETKKNKEKEISCAEADFKEAMWEAKKSFPKPLVDHAFAGNLGSGVKFANYLKGRLDAHKEVPEIEHDEDALVGRLTALKKSDASVPIQEFQPKSIFFSEPTLLQSALGKELTQDTNSRLSKMLARLGHTEWVSEGTKYLDQSDDTCPFCQQTVDTKLAEEILALFDTEFESAKVTLMESQDQLDSRVANIDNFIKSLKGIEIVNTSSLKEKLLELQQHYNHVRQLISMKLAAMDTPFEIGGRIDTAEIEKAFSSINSAIRSHNYDLANKTKSLEGLKQEIQELFFARKDVITAYSAYKGKIESPARTLKAIKPKIVSAEDKQEKLREEYENCLSQLTSPLDVMNEMNQVLRGLGFNSFSLQLFGEDRDQYQIVRHDGSRAERLSEGEKTLIAFLYFYNQVVQKSDDKSITHGMWAVLDDPISSLDSQTLTAISHLCRRLANKCLETNNCFERFFLLTHNAYFYQEATYTDRRNKPTKEQRLYGTIRKSHDGYSRLYFSEDNQIDSIYNSLWREIKHAREDSVMTVNVQNAMRRILEVYFKMVSGGIDGDLIDRLSIELQLPAVSLLSWTNDGSHQIRFDLDSANTNLENSVYFRAFENIFRETDQYGHYQMMMDEEIKVVKTTGV